MNNNFRGSTTNKLLRLLIIINKLILDNLSLMVINILKKKMAEKLPKRVIKSMTLVIINIF